MVDLLAVTLPDLAGSFSLPAGGIPLGSSPLLLFRTVVLVVFLTLSIVALTLDHPSPPISLG